MLRVGLCVILLANPFSAPYCAVTCGLSACSKLFHAVSQKHEFQGKVFIIKYIF